MATASLVVLGGGVVGLCTAYHAVRRGHRVTVLERGEPGHDCCSLGNAGFIVPSHFVPLAAPGTVRLGLRMLANPRGSFGIRWRPNPELFAWGYRFWRSATAAHVARSAPLLCELLRASRQLFEDMADASGNAFGLARRGLLMLCKTDHALREEAEAAHAARRLGMPAEVLSPAEAARRDPAVRMDVAGAVHFPEDCHLAPARLMAWLTDALQAAGVRFEWDAEVVGWRVHRRRVEAARTRRGDFAADEFVVAGGSWSAQVLRPLGLRLPLQAGKGYSLTLPRPPRLPSVPSLLIEARVAVTPLGEALRFGGTMEIGGLDLSVNPRRVQGLLEAIPQYYPEFGPEDFRGLPVWSGLRPCSPDGLPYVGRFGRYDNLSAATGHAMLGVSLGPITGRLLAEVLSGDRPSIDIGLLRPDRFG